MSPVVETDLPLPGKRTGKVRDVYELPARDGRPPALLIVATDRLSAFDVVLPTPIPGKGVILTDLAARWFGFIESRGICRTHLLSTDHEQIPDIPAAERSRLRGRVTIGRRCRVVPVECVVRGHLAGSGWVDYRETGSVCGVELARGLRSGDRIVDASGAPAPIFTPATKAEQGAHDENISFERACGIAGERMMQRLRELSLAIYTAASEYARGRGLILADTKFEFGVPVDARGEPEGDEPMLVDEALTPDSSRYWPAEAWSPGGEQPSFDKQFVREHLLRLVERGAWDKTAPGPSLPEDVVRSTLDRYEEARRRLFGG